MSNISRRNFIKGAGVAALAVAAAGVLAGCSTDAVDNTPREVTIHYYFVDDKQEIGTQKLTLTMKDHTVPADKLKIPQDYKLYNEKQTEFPIDENNDVKVEVTGTRSATKNVGINFVCGSNLNSEEIVIGVDSDMTAVPVQTLKDLLAAYYPDYQLAEEKDAVLNDQGIANVQVVKKA